MKGLDLYIFDVYLKSLYVLITFFLWGWGLLYTLSKVGKYRGMLWGALGCLGLMLLCLINDALLQVPDFFLVWSKGVLKFKDDVSMFLEKAKPYHGLNVAYLFFQICIIAGLAGRFKQEEAEPPSVKVQKFPPKRV